MSWLSRPEVRVSVFQACHTGIWCSALNNFEVGQHITCYYVTIHLATVQAHKLATYLAVEHTGKRTLSNMHYCHHQRVHVVQCVELLLYSIMMNSSRTIATRCLLNPCTGVHWSAWCDRYGMACHSTILSSIQTSKRLTCYDFYSSILAAQEAFWIRILPSQSASSWLQLL